MELHANLLLWQWLQLHLHHTGHRWRRYVRIECSRQNMLMRLNRSHVSTLLLWRNNCLLGRCQLKLVLLLIRNQQKKIPRKMYLGLGNWFAETI